LREKIGAHQDCEAACDINDRRPFFGRRDGHAGHKLAKRYGDPFIAGDCPPRQRCCEIVNHF